MLVLSRKVKEELVVPHCQLTVTVLEISGNRVRLGISAPAGIAVHRREVWQRNHQGAVLEIGETMMSVRVLIADTDEFLAESYRKYLHQYSADVSTATTGLECMERLREFNPQVLVLEPAILWGGGDGVLALLNERPELRPAFVILLTYGRDRSLLHRVSKFKVDDYQIKPLSAKQLSERICTLLVRRELDLSPALTREQSGACTLPTAQLLAR
jgi:carbon storage regulator